MPAIASPPTANTITMARFPLSRSTSRPSAMAPTADVADAAVIARPSWARLIDSSSRMNRARTPIPMTGNRAVDIAAIRSPTFDSSRGDQRDGVRLKTLRPHPWPVRAYASVVIEAGNSSRIEANVGRKASGLVALEATIIEPSRTST